MKKLAQGFNTAAQDLNPDFHSREYEALPLSHCACASLVRKKKRGRKRKLKLMKVVKASVTAVSGPGGEGDV